MGKKSKRQNVTKVSRNQVIAYGVLASLVAAIAYFGWYAMTPANGTYPVFALRDNHFIKASYSTGQGYHYVSMSSGSVKGARTNGGGSIVSPGYTLAKGNVQSIHFINEDQETHSQHNLNIDAFNVHTRDLGYYGSQTIDFMPDKEGTFEYYCSIHPEMKGEITVVG